jgi:hypothetical protein
MGTWWGRADVQLDSAVRWRIAGLGLWVQRAEREWKIVWDWPAEWADSLSEVEKEVGVEPPADDTLDAERHVLVGTNDSLELLPATADRAVVTMPRVPLFLAPHEESRLYVGSPLWVRLRVGESRTLREIPIRRPSDTFFGASTMEGELCYATRSRAVSTLDGVQWSARRAVTPLRIRNASSDALPLERLKIPVDLLSVFAEGSRLWTERIDVVVGHEPLAELTIQRGPPEEAHGARLVTEPRAPADHSGPLMRVFDDLVSMTRGL